MLGYDSLANFYQTNFSLLQHHKYSLAEFDEMMPWEKQIYVKMLTNYIKEQNEKMKQLQQQQQQQSKKKRR